MARSNNVRMTPKMLRLLALLEQGPKYGRQFALIAPDLFFCNDEISRNGSMNRRSSPVSNIYSLLKRAEDGGLIEELKDFKAAANVLEDEAPSTKRKYYSITVQGKEMLSNARAIVN